MTKTRNTILALVAVLLSPMAANADLIEITATSSAQGVLGSFVVDTLVLEADGDGFLFASQLFDYDFLDPLTSVALNTGNVTGDTGRTVFAIVSGVWTVTNGIGDSLTDSTLGHGLWIAGTNVVSFTNGGTYYQDVTWGTSAYSVPEPGTLALLGIGLLGMGAARRRKKA